MKTRLKLKTGTYDTFVLGQIKIGWFYETVTSVEVLYSRDVLECKRIAKERLQAYLEAGFDKNGVIEL